MSIIEKIIDRLAVIDQEKALRNVMAMDRLEFAAIRIGKAFREVTERSQCLSFLNWVAENIRFAFVQNPFSLGKEHDERTARMLDEMRQNINRNLAKRGKFYLVGADPEAFRPIIGMRLDPSMQHPDIFADMALPSHHTSLCPIDEAARCHVEGIKPKTL